MKQRQRGRSMQQENRETENLTLEGRNMESGQDGPKTQGRPGELEKKNTPSGVIKELFSWIFTIAAAVALALFLNQVVLINATIPSGSMENTIMEGDRLLGFRLAYKAGDPKRGDIIIFKYPDNEEENYIKRVIGLPGETIEIRDAKIYINGSDTPLEEGYLKEEWVVETGPYTFEVPEDCYLVLGDNRNNSKDARYWANTYVARDKILGKAWFRYYPLNSMGVLK